MRLADIHINARYVIKGDVVEVTAITEGTNERTDKITFKVVVPSARRAGKRDVGFERTWGRANFANWAHPA